MYDAFVSYSHAADGRLAPALQRAMQRLAKPWYRPRALRVFRDESALSTNPHLWSSIQTALDEAEWFVLLASPEAVQSEWVNRELEYWLEHKSVDRILPVVTDGSWDWREGALWGTAVPRSLAGAFGEEPRHLDLRWARSQTDLDIHNARFRDASAQLAAPIHGVAKDDLESEDVRQHRHARRLARGGVSILALLVVIALVFGGAAIVERDRADHNASVARAQAKEAIATKLAALSRLQSASDASLEMLLAVEGYDRQSDPTTRDALLAAVTNQPQLVGFMPGIRNATTGLVARNGSVVVAGTSDGSVAFWQPGAIGTHAVTTVRAPSLEGSPVRQLAISRNGSRLLSLHNNGLVQQWDVATHVPIGQPFNLGVVGGIALSPDGRELAVATPLKIDVWDIASRRRVRQLGPAIGFDNVHFSPLGTRLYAEKTQKYQGNPDGLFEFDNRTGQVLSGPVAATTGDFSVAGVDELNLVVVRPSQDGRTVTVINPSPGETEASALGPSPAPTVEYSYPAEPGGPIAVGSQGWPVAVGAKSGTINVWTMANQQLLVPPLRAGRSRIVGLSVADDGTSVVSTAGDGTVALWDLSAANELARGPLVDPTQAFVPHFGGFFDKRPLPPFESVSVWDPNAELLETGSPANFEGPGTLWDTKTSNPKDAGRITGCSKSRPSTSALGTKRCLLDFIVTGTGDLRGLRGVESKRELSSDLRIWLVQRRDSARGAAASRAAVVDAVTGQRLAELSLPAAVPALRAAARSGFRLHHRQVLSLLFSAGAVDDGHRRVAVLDQDRDVIVWSLADGGPEALLPAGSSASRPTAVALSSDGSEIAVGFSDGSVARYQVPSLQPIGTLLSGRESSIGFLAYQPGGDLLASAGAGGVDLIDRRSNVVIATIAHPAVVGSDWNGDRVQFDAYGTRLFTDGYLESRPALLWSMVPTDWVADACRSAGRNLTRAEWSQFVGTDVPYHRTCPEWPAGS
jgi:WD40 repeat protein